MNEKKSPGATPQPVLIRKYANRRLYNMETSTYVTLDDLAELVKKNVQFSVRDAKTDSDLTRQVLMQILLEKETAGTEMLPIEMLRGLIRYYDTDMHQSLSNYLATSMSSFVKNQDEMMRGFKGFGDWSSIQETQAEWFRKTMEMMNPMRPTKP